MIFIFRLYRQTKVLLQRMCNEMTELPWVAICIYIYVVSKELYRQGNKLLT